MMNETTTPPDLILYAIPMFILGMLLELAIVRRQAAHGAAVVGYGAKDSAANIAMGLGNVAATALWKAVAYAAYLALWHWTPLRTGFGWPAWLALLFADDLAFYWYHRVHHESRFFWASHVVHHSSQTYNLSTALRQPWVVFTSTWFWAPLALLGFHPTMIVTMQAVSLLYQFWLHTETVRTLGPLEWVMNTPSHHRGHHAMNARYIDCNYAGVFILWDRLFGTFVPESAEDPPRYGITKQLRTFNPLRIAFHEYADIWRDVRRARTWRERFGRTFRNPAWQPPAAPAGTVTREQSA